MKRIKNRVGVVEYLGFYIKPSTPSSASCHTLQYCTPKWYQWILLGLDRIGLPLYYSNWSWDFPFWRISPLQRDVIKSLHQMYSDGRFNSPSDREFLSTLLMSSHYNQSELLRLNLILINNWKYYGKRETDWNHSLQPYPPYLKWKLRMDSLFKFKWGDTYEYE